MSEPRSLPHLDCCGQPRLLTIKGLYESNHDAESIERCESCGARWFYRYHEQVNYIDDSGDDWTCWHSRLTPDEAASLLAANDRPDLTFLQTRPSFMCDANGTQTVNGQPSEPWS